MNRLIFVISSILALAFMPSADVRGASSSGGSSSGDGDVHGRIQNVSTTNFSVGIRNAHGRHHRLYAVVVHYNPETASITIDGVAVKILDTTAAGKYVSIVGTMNNHVLEATSITVSSTAPARTKRGKSEG